MIIIDDSDFLYEQYYRDDFEVYVSDLKQQLKNTTWIYEDNDKVVLQDNRTKQKLAVSRCGYKNISILKADNPKLDIYNKLGYRINNYFEVVLSGFLYNDTQINILSEVNQQIHFALNDITATISPPSDIFYAITYAIYGVHHQIDDYYITISLKDITNDNCYDYFYQTLYLLKILPPCPNQIDINQHISESIANYSIKNKYYEVFKFYFEANRLINSEISSLYFYKVIEYFFIIVRQQEIEEDVKKYQLDQNIDRLMDLIRTIHANDELSQLTFLVHSLLNELTPIFIKAKEIGIINTIDDVKTFSYKMYKYRNSIVHGKSDHKFDIKAPNVLNETVVDLFWKDVFKLISDILLLKYCIIKKG